MVSAGVVGVEDEVEGVEDEQGGGESHELADTLVAHEERLGHRAPRVVVVDVVVVLVVLAVRHAPAVEGNQNRGVADVTEEIVDGQGVAERAVAWTRRGRTGEGGWNFKHMT